MDESQEVPELPTKKARHDPEVSQEGNSRSVAANDSSDSPNRNESTAQSEVNSYPPSSVTHLHTIPGGPDRSNQESISRSQGCDSENAYDHNVTCKDLTTTTASEYTSQIYQGSNTAYASQVAFPSLGQSTIYSSFPQSGQTYGLPPFGSMWPGLKTESRLPEAPSVGQTGFLSFSSAYTSTQHNQIHYSYPSQGKPATALSVCLHTLSEFSSYNSLGQSQFSQYYVPPPSYLSAGLPSSDREGAGVVAPEYPAIKTEGSASANLPNTTGVLALSLFVTNIRNSFFSQRVFLWDLDETIIIFHSLLTGSFAQKFGKDPAAVLNLGLQIEELIFELADTHLFFNDLEECDQVHVDDVVSDDNGQDLSNYNFSSDGFSGPSAGGGPGSTTAVQGGVEWMRKLAFRYRRLKEIYNGFKGNVGGLLSPMKRDLLLRLCSEIETVTDAWLSTALKSLLLVQSRGRCINVLVTTTQLVPALAKVLLYGLGDVFPIENIYSATKIGKESCFERIISRFGKKVTYVVIGDGRDEEFAAKQHNMPFWRISSHGDLISLHQALELDFL
uniref:Eyes absent homolog n=1 Tax=Sinocyclocheilus anshuiensis TaxID=1608454 RepID=A0A671N8V5_9TELE